MVKITWLGEKSTLDKPCIPHLDNGSHKIEVSGKFW